MNVCFRLNTDWAFCMGEHKNAWKEEYDDHNFVAVTLPHSMRLESKSPGNYSSVFQGIGWYRKYFTLEKRFEGKRIVLEFDGVMMESQLYLNGKPIFNRKGGYIGFCVDISPYVKFGATNVLAVRVSSMDNPEIPPGKPLEKLDFHYYGGIYRDVRLHIMPYLYIPNPLEAKKPASGGVFITYPLVSEMKAEIQIQTQIANQFPFAVDTKVSHILYDGEEKRAFIESSPIHLTANSEKKTVVKLEISSPKLWSPDTPNLYKLETTLWQEEKAIFQRTDVIGIRYVEAKKDGIYLNGKKLYLWGANRHQCYPFVGDAAPASMQYRDAILLKQNGFNAVRAAHYPQSPDFLDACDQYGLLVIECQPGWQNFTDSAEFYQHTIRDIREMIRRDRNHPCVFLWETSLNETVCSRNWAEDAVCAAKEEMPGNQMLTATDYQFHGDLYDVNYKVIDKPGEEYIDQAPEKPVLTREWGDWSGLDQAFRGSGKKALTQQVLTHQRFLNGDGYPDWGGLTLSKRLGGCFLWSWNDYSRGSENQPLYSGSVETERLKKPLFYWMQSMMNPRQPSSFPMVYIDSTYQSFSDRTIHVYSNCDSVSLYRNGELIGKLSRQEAIVTGVSENIVAWGGSPIFLFSLPDFQPGELLAKAYLDGIEVAVHSVKTPGIAAKIEICPQTLEIEPVADGSDLIPVFFRVVDQQGTLVTEGSHILSISVTGKGTLVGKGIQRLSVENQVTEAGIGFAFIRTTEEPGEINISVSTKGLASSESTLHTLPNQAPIFPFCTPRIWRKDGETPALPFPQEQYLEISGKLCQEIGSGKSVRFIYGMGQWLAEAAVFWNFSEICGAVLKISHDGKQWKSISPDFCSATDGTALFYFQESRYVCCEIPLTTAEGLHEPEISAYRKKEKKLYGDFVLPEQIVRFSCSSPCASDRGPEKLFDGDTLIGTGWMTESNKLPQSVTVRFSKPVSLCGSQIFWEKDSSWYRYGVEISQDGHTWVTAITSRLAGGQEHQVVLFENSIPEIWEARLTVYEVISGSGVPRIGAAEWRLFLSNR